MPEVFRSWRSRLVGIPCIPKRIRYTRKSTEQDDRQAASHKQQAKEMDWKFGRIDERWWWRDNFTGTTFDRPAFQDMVAFCRAHPQPASQKGVIEMYAPSRFGRILGTDGEPDVKAYMRMYLALDEVGWELEFVTLTLTDRPDINFLLIASAAFNDASFSSTLSRDVSRGKRDFASEGWWVHAIPPFGAQKFDTRTQQVIKPGENASGKGGGIILIPHEQEVEHWTFAAKRLLEGFSYRDIADMLYDRGVRARTSKRSASQVPKRLTHGQIRNILTKNALVGVVE